MALHPQQPNNPGADEEPAPTLIEEKPVAMTTEKLTEELKHCSIQIQPYPNGYVIQMGCIERVFEGTQWDLAKLLHKLYSDPTDFLVKYGARFGL